MRLTLDSSGGKKNQKQLYWCTGLKITRYFPSLRIYIYLLYCFDYKVNCSWKLNVFYIIKSIVVLHYIIQITCDFLKKKCLRKIFLLSFRAYADVDNNLYPILLSSVNASGAKFIFLCSRFAMLTGTTYCTWIWQLLINTDTFWQEIYIWWTVCIQIYKQ